MVDVSSGDDERVDHALGQPPEAAAASAPDDEERDRVPLPVIRDADEPRRQGVRHPHRESPLDGER